MPFRASSRTHSPGLCPRAGVLEGKATKASRQPQLPILLLALGQPIHLANSSVLNQRLRSPSCDILSGKTEMEQSGGEGGEGSQGQWLWGKPCHLLLSPLEVSGRNSDQEYRPLMAKWSALKAYPGQSYHVWQR